MSSRDVLEESPFQVLENASRLLNRYSKHMLISWVVAVAKEAAAERFGPDAKIRNDMLGSFVRNGLTQPQLASEALLQMFVFFPHY